MKPGPFRLLVVALALGLPAVASAAIIEIKVDPVGGPSLTEEVTLVLAPLGGHGEATAQEQSKTRTAPGTWRVELPAGSAWEVTATAAGRWAAPLTLRVPAEGAPPAPVSLRLFLTTPVLASVEQAPGLPPSPEVEVFFEPTQPGREPAPEGSMRCPLAGGKLDCALPVGVHDLRLRRAGAPQEYRWGVRLEPGKVAQLGKLSFRPGASVVGWVESSEDGAPVAGCRVSLAPEAAGAAPDPSSEKRLGKAALTTTTDLRGFFQLKGVSPGSYVLGAEKESFAPAWLAPIRVDPGLESRLKEPLRLGRPLTLRVQLEPALDPFGRRWRAQLASIAGESRRTTQLEPSVDEEGRLAIPGLAPDVYRLRILDADGSHWESQRLDLAADTDLLTVHLPLLAVHGTLHRGEDPVSATLWFGGLSGARRVKMAADLDGRFEGFLPAEGSWNVDLLLIGRERDHIALGEVEVRPRKGKGYAEVELTLPDTHLAGEVVDSQGRAVPGAAVDALSGRMAAGLSSVTADAKGKFEFQGLRVGETLVNAHLGERESERSLVFLQEKLESPELRLVLRGTQKAHGSVVSRGTPVAGARILALPDFGPTGGASLAQALSGPDGSFSIDLPEGAAGAAVLVSAPGLPVRLLRLDTNQERILVDLDPSGGRLRLDLSALVVKVGRIAAPFLVHEGTLFPAPVLQQLSGSAGNLLAPIEIASAEPGLYALCRGRAAAAAVNAGDGAVPGCASGQLLPAGELTLALPAGRDGAP